MSVITISRQLSSHGSQIGRMVAQQLGWRWVSRDVINQAAVKAGVPQVALAEIDELGLFGLKPSAKERQAYLEQVQTVIADLAEQGNVVIVGRGSQVICRERPDSFHVRVVAPLQTRIARFQLQKNVSAQTAQSILLESDRARTRYLQKNFAVQVNDPTLYHLVLNTGFWQIVEAAALLHQAYQQWSEIKRGADDQA